MLARLLCIHVLLASRNPAEHHGLRLSTYRSQPPPQLLARPSLWGALGVFRGREHVAAPDGPDGDTGHKSGEC